MVDPTQFGGFLEEDDDLSPESFGAAITKEVAPPVTERPPSLEPTAPPPPSPDEGIGSDIQRQLGLTVRAGVEGITALPALLAEPIRLGLNLIPGVQIAPQQQVVSSLLTQAGVPSPETAQEKIAGGAAQALAGGGVPIAAGRTLVDIAPTIAKTLMASPSLQALSATAGGGAVGLAKEKGVGTGGQIAAGVAASVLAPTAVGVGKFALDAAKHPFSVVKSSLTPAPKKAEMELAQTLKDDSLSVDKAIAELKKIGPEAMVSDLGENVSSLARRIESVPGLAKRLATKELNARQLNRNQRVNDAIKGSLGNGDDFFRTMDDINLIRKTAAAPKYSEAYQAEIELTDEIKELLSRPAGISAWAKAQKIAANEGAELPQNITKTADGAEAVSPPSMRTYDYIKRGMDDVIQSHTDDFGRIKTDVGRSVQAVKSSFVKALDKQNKAYKEAREIFSGHSGNLDAMNKGRGFLKDDSEITSKLVKRMTDSEKEMFRLGAARAIRDKVLSAPDGADAYKRIFGNGLIREKLRTAFPSNESYETFARMMKAEKIMAATRQKVTGESPTARIQAEQATSRFEDQSSIDLARGNLMSATVSKARQALEKLRTPDTDVSNQLAGMLFTRDPESNIKILQGLEATMKGLPQKQQESFAKAIIKAMAIQQGNIAAQQRTENQGVK